MYFMNALWDGKINSTNGNLLCDVCGHRLGEHGYRGNSCIGIKKVPTFEAHGYTWTRHTPGDAMPCDDDARIDILLPDGPSCLNPRIPSCVDWGSGVDGWGVIGWRYADSAKPEVQSEWTSIAEGWAVIAPVGVPVVVFDGDTAYQLKEENITRYLPGITPALPEHIECAEGDDGSYALFGIDQISVGGVTYYRNDLSPLNHSIKRMADALSDGTFNQDESERNDLIAAVDDGHLTPGQKAYIQAKEDAQAAKQQLAKDAQDKALQERAGQLADAGKAMDRVNQDHGHRLGWMQ